MQKSSDFWVVRWLLACPLDLASTQDPPAPRGAATTRQDPLLWELLGDGLELLGQQQQTWRLPGLVNIQKAIENGHLIIVDLPIKNIKRGGSFQFVFCMFTRGYVEPIFCGFHVQKWK